MKKLKTIIPLLVISLFLVSGLIINSSIQIQQGVQTDEWWDTNYSYRRMITLTEPGVADRVLEPVDVFLVFSQGEATVDSIRVVFYNGSEWIEEPSQVWNETTHMINTNTYYTSCTVTFLANITKSSQKIYYIYYDDTYNVSAAYDTKIWAAARNSSAPLDNIYPWVYDATSKTNYTWVDMIDIRTAYSNETAS
ncbi:MAG: hypothetical protein ACTSQY_08960, partial [Candidatus Odinarchaeia archaeon]